MWYLFCCLEVLDWSFVWKFWLEALNNYVIFILLLCEYLIETFFVLKYVALYFYMWYTELVCLFEYWVCILCLLYFTELVVSIVDFVFFFFAVLVTSVHLGILCTATWKEYWKCKRIFLWTSLLFMIFLLCTSLLYEFYFVLLLYLESTGDFCMFGYSVYCYLEMQRGNIENVYGNFFFEPICYSRYFYCVLLCYTNFILCYWQNQCVFVV